MDEFMKETIKRRFDLSDCILYTNQIVFMSPVKNDRAYFFA